MDPAQWSAKEVLIWVGGCKFPPAVVTFLQEREPTVAGLNYEDVNAILRAIDRLKSVGPPAEVVQAIEDSRDTPPSLSRGNSKESGSKRKKLKAFFSNLFGHKTPDPPRLQHATSIEGKAHTELIEQFASDGSALLLPQCDLTGVSLNSPLWNEVMARYRQFGCPQVVSVPVFSDLQVQWRIREYDSHRSVERSLPSS